MWVHREWWWECFADGLLSGLELAGWTAPMMPARIGGARAVFDEGGSMFLFGLPRMLRSACNGIRAGALGLALTTLLAVSGLTFVSPLLQEQTTILLRSLVAIP